MKVSKSTIFDISNDMPFTRMAPTLTQNYDEKELVSSAGVVMPS